MVEEESVTSKVGYVIGSPITHSKSPAIHLAAYQELGLDWSYQKVEVPEGNLSDFMAHLALESTSVVSVTMPLKIEAAEFATRSSPLVQATGIANTLIPRNGEWFAENTDVFGITRTLGDRDVKLSGSASVTVLGSGATAISALAALAELGFSQASVVSRNQGALAEMARIGESFSISLAAVELPESDLAPTDELTLTLGADLVISTLPSEVATRLGGWLPKDVGFLFDVTYHPWPSGLAKSWFTNGGDVVGGLDLLVNQAAAQIEMATDRPAPIAAMRSAVGLTR